MRKFTLLFMSLFLTLGTVMAQKEEDKNEPVEFGISWMSPEDGALTTSVYNIMMGFTEDVTVTFPEGGIDVVNNETKEVVKITSVYEGDEYYPKNQVQFLFEQKLVPGKDGKEELQSVIIETPGSYSYTIPAGCIKSVDGDEFPETTFTFSIVATFPVGYNYTPQQTTAAIENIVVTFEQEITKVQLPEYPMYVVDSYWNPMASVTNVTIGEDKKTVTLELDAPITTPGYYTLDINQGVFATADAINSYSTLYFQIIDTKPSFSTNYKNGDRVKELSNVLEITFMNVKNPEIAEGAKIFLLTPARDEVEGTIEKVDYGFVVTFDADLTETGVYTFIIPENTFIFDGQVHEEGATIEVELYSFELKELEIKDVYPKAGDTVDKLESIIILFNQAVTLSQDADLQQISREIKLTCGDQEYTLTYNSNYWVSTLDQIEYLVNAEYDYTKNDYVVNPITAAGTYTLDASQIVVDYGAEWITDEYATYVNTWHAKNGSCEGTYSWTVSAGEGEGIKATEAAANGEQVIYDLLGRRVEKISGAGIYIVNGKKVVIK